MVDIKKDKVLVLGGTGFLGKNFPRLNNWKFVGRKDCDLLDKKATEEFFHEESPNVRRW